MASMFASHTLIAGGTFIQSHGDVHYHGLRESSDILHRATATAAFHNSKDRFDPPKCHPNTRLAVLNKIMRWINWQDDVDAFVMWLYGPAGSGKSAIAQTIAEMCEEEMILLANFFFSRNDPSRSNVNPLIATIAYQITLNLPQVRDTILGAIERDPLIFSKSLAVQFKSLIVAPLLPLADAGFFSEPTSCRLVIIDGLDECFDPKVQRNIVEVLGSAQRQHRLPLIFLFASRPEQPISLAFNMGMLPSVLTRIALDRSYSPDDDIGLFLTDKFQEIKFTHPLRAHIPSQWPCPDVLKQLICKSSGQFIYASTVIHFVSSIRHKPTDRLDIILGVHPPQKDLPFAELDALYMHILSSMEDIDPVLEFLSLLIIDAKYPWKIQGLTTIEEFLSLQSGDVELYLGDLSSLVSLSTSGPRSDQSINVLHASLTDFLLDPTRSREFWINPQARHTAFARRCLQLLQLKAGNIKMFAAGFENAICYLENAELTPELHDDLINFSLDNLHNTINAQSGVTYAIPHLNITLKMIDHLWYNLYRFTPSFIQCLKKLSAEADYIWQPFQNGFDRMLRNVLEKCYSFPGFTLLLGGLLRLTRIKQRSNTFTHGMKAFWYLIRNRGDGHMLDESVFKLSTLIECPLYFTELLENPQRSGIHIFDQQRYATAATECLQLHLCDHRTFSNEAAAVSEFAHRDRILRRNKPSAWRARLGVHSRIRKGRRHFKVLWWRSIEAGGFIEFRGVVEVGGIVDFGGIVETFPRKNGFDQEYLRFFEYRWALDLFPFLLKRSAVSLELADMLRSFQFAMMAWGFPRRMRLAREAVENYLLRVESA